MSINGPRIALFLTFGFFIIRFISLNQWIPACVFGVVLILGYFVSSKQSNQELENELSPERTSEPSLCYYGSELNFPDDTLIEVLSKYFNYYTALPEKDKQKFLKRLQIFIADKTFRIHDKSGFREMPILISASAIELTFGLENYLLPHFKFINIFPEEFVRKTAEIDFLEGNVSGQSINLSWKHFMEGFKYPDDGQNVGLHEMSHALYYQNFIAEENEDKNFQNTFEEFNNYGNKVFKQGESAEIGLYSDYAFRNTQEFWAESIEIFFEKSIEMKSKYPTVYQAVSDILNQDPAQNITSVKTS